MTFQSQADNGSNLERFVCVMLSMLFLLTAAAGAALGDRGDSDTGSGETDTGGVGGGTTSQVSMVSADISGSVLGGYAEITDIRELYNGGSSTAVTYLFALTTGGDINELDISTGSGAFSYQESTEWKTDQEVLDDGDTVFMRYVDVADGEKLIEQYVASSENPALFTLSGYRFFAFQFPMDGFGFATVSITYTSPVEVNGGLQQIDLALTPAAVLAKGAADMTPASDGGVSVHINTVGTLEGVYSPTHDVSVGKNGLHDAWVNWTGNKLSGDTMSVYFNELRSAFGAGFLNYRLEGKTMFQENEDGYFMFLFNPNTEEFEEHAMAKDIVFIIDTSGSMDGNKMSTAKDALKDVLAVLSVGDRFTIIRFSTSVSTFKSELVMANAENIEDAQSWVSGLSSSGSTDINSALLKGLDILKGSQESGRPREIIFLTDGEATAGVTNNENILENVYDENVIGEVDATLHVFGIGYSINTFLLDSLPEDSGGSTTYIGPEEDIDEVLAPFYATIASPVLTDITLEIEGVNTMQHYPEKIPNLYNGGELNIVGVYQLPDPVPETVEVYINGTTTDGNTSYIFTFPMEDPGKHDFLPRIYAARAVGDILNDIKKDGETDEKIESVKRYGRRYGIETPYSSLTIHTNSQFDSEGFRTLTGEASVKASGLIKSYSQTKIASKGLISNARVVEGRTFLKIGGVYIQSDLLPEDEVIDLEDSSFEEWINENITINRFVKFGSQDYFTLASDSEKLDILALGSEIVFEDKGETIGITRGNLFLYIKNLRTSTWGQNLSVSWETNVPASTVVRYRSISDNVTGNWVIVRETELTNLHNMTLNLPFMKYEFSIESTDADGNTAVKDNNQENFVAVHHPLAIIAVQSSVGYAVMNGQEVTIRWYTNVPADGEVYIGSPARGWDLVGATTNKQVHEATFTVSMLDPTGSSETVYFYVTSDLGNHHVVEDNNGQYFSFDVVTVQLSSPSFDPAIHLIVFAVGFVALISTVFSKYSSRKDDSGDTDTDENQTLPTDTDEENPNDSKRNRNRTMLGSFGSREDVEIGKNGSSDTEE